MGGLPINTNEEEIITYFKKYGNIKDIKLIKRKGEVKDYAFIEFLDIESSQKCLQDYEKHFIRGKWFDVKPSFKKNNNYNINKIDISRKKTDIEENEFDEFTENRIRKFTNSSIEIKDSILNIKETRFFDLLKI